MAIGDVYRMSRKVIIDGVETVNILHFQDIEGNISEPEISLFEHWDNDGQPCPENDLKFLQVGFVSFTPVSFTVQKIAPVEGELFEFPFTVRSYNPTDDGLPTFAQIATTYTTALNSRSGRGRNFWAGVADAHTTGNQFNSAGQALMNTFIQSLVDHFTENGADYIGFVIGVFSELLEDFNAATSISNSGSIGSMVSRRVGRGN